MLAVSYDVAFRGENICSKFGCVLSDFQQEAPKPKTHIVDIPAGNDLDITESLGPVAFHDGVHTLKFGFKGDDALDRVRSFAAFVHGVRGSYVLSWAAGWTYTGRWKVTDIERINQNAVVVTVDIEHAPFREQADSVTINAHPTASYAIEGSARYKNVSVTLLQNATIRVDGQVIGTYAAGTTVILPTLAQDAVISVTVADWYYYIDGTNLVVNPNYYTQSGTNVDLDNSVFVIDGTNIRCDAEADQYATISFIREDF